MGCYGRKYKAASEQEQTMVSGKKKCFACKETSHTLDQCRIKDNLVTVAPLFGHSTRFPFYMIQPSDEVVENEKFYHHSLLVTSNTSNLDPTRVKTELNKFWKLTGDWEIRREGTKNFTASFNSEDDLISCLKPPNVETFLDEKEVKFTVARWDECAGEKFDLIRKWVFVYGVPGTYRNWKELYQVASAVGVLLEVDEESLGSGDKEPIRLRIALGSLVGAPFSYPFVFGWSSILVKFMIEDKAERMEGQRKELEEQSGIIMMEYENISEHGIEVPQKTLSKEMNSESTGVTLAGNYSMDIKGCSDEEQKEELKTTEAAALLEVAKFIAELRSDGAIKENNTSAMAATTTNLKKAAEVGRSTCESSTGGDHMLGLEGCSDNEHREELKTWKTATLLEVPKFTEEFTTDGKNKENNASAITGTRTDSEKTTEYISEAEGGQSISGSSTSLIAGSYRGIQKPPIKNVYTRRRGRKQKESTEASTLFADISSDSAHESIQKPPIKIVYERKRYPKEKGSTEQQAASEEANNGINPGSSSNTTRVVTSTCNVLDSKSSLEKEHEKEMKMAETGLLGKGLKSTEESGDGEKKHSKVRTSTTYYTRKKTAPETLRAEGGQPISGNSECMIRISETEGVAVPGTTPEGAQFDGKQHVSKMTTRPTQICEEFNTYNEIYDSFTKMGLRENLLKGIYAYGLEKPSAVHQRGIVPLCKGLDVIQQSLYGTTVTLACGVLQRLDYGSAECQALVLVPTRDLAQETEKVIGALGQWLGVKAHACFGGTSVRGDNQFLSSSVQVIVATPGRVLDMLRRRALCPDNIRMFVLDEADEILTGGLKDQIYDIIQLLPSKIQFGVFCTTMSHEALELCRKCMHEPMKVIVPKDEELKGISIKQFYVKVEKEESKFDELCDLFRTMAVTQCIIFVNARRKVKSLAEKMRGMDYTVSTSHGGMDQQAREVAIQDLSSGSSRVLVTTDLRGADALEVPVVINYDLPTQPVQYLRHVQRSRGKGVTISFVTRADNRVLSDIQRFCNAPIAELPSSTADLQ
ncbi:ATP-dependent RNA helicase DRS1-like [Lolium rigidum]|uniref:ATP-dependent RNA helicase DRS1-like n=1 Tax=Lolium rigidum TaxID=89674 RepID=UPI001F5C3AA5|nr:ATP-dependent RNA helicase DRS1-like [Lolium rigidum]